MKPVLLCLHGWGGSKESFTELRAALEDEDLLILTPDLPGFGDEPQPARPWSVADYADWVERWVEQTLPPSPYPLLLLGHSHGGRIAITLASRRQTIAHRTITHLFLCAAAGIRRPSLKRTFGKALSAVGKAVFALPGLTGIEPKARKALYKILREHDYERASPLMRQTLARVTGEDLTPLLSRITVPTDLFWGEEDRQTPLVDGKLMHERIKGSVLHTFAGTRHRVHRDRAQEIASVIRNAL